VSRPPSGSTAKSPVVNLASGLDGSISKSVPGYPLDEPPPPQCRILNGIRGLGSALKEHATDYVFNHDSEFLQDFELKLWSVTYEDHSIVYYVTLRSKDGRQECTKKLGFSNCPKARFGYYDKEFEVEEECAILDIDILDVKQDQRFRKLIAQHILEPFANEQLPTTMKEMMDYQAKTGIPPPMQFFLHTMYYTLEQSPSHGGGKNVIGVFRNFAIRLAESALQEATGLGDVPSSMHEMLRFDWKALNKSKEVANTVCDRLLDVMLQKLKLQQLKQLVTLPNLALGNWEPGGLRPCSAAKPLLILAMMNRIDEYGDYIDVSQPDEKYKSQNFEFKDAYKKPTPAGANCYKPEIFYGLEDHQDAVEEVKLFIDEVNVKGGFHAMDPNKIAFDNVADENLATIMNERGFQDIAYFDSELQVWYNGTQGGKSAFIFSIRPLCFILHSQEECKIENHVQVMTKRAIGAEAVRLLLYRLKNDKLPPKEGELHMGDLLIMFAFYMYCALNLQMNKKTGSLASKHILVPLKYNMMSPFFHGLVFPEVQGGAIGLRSRDMVKRADMPRTREADDFSPRNAANRLSHATSTNVREVAKAVLHRLGLDLHDKPVSRDLFLVRFKRIVDEKRGYIKGELRTILISVKEELQPNQGNRTNHAVVTSVVIKRNDIKFEQVIALLLDGATEVHFWVYGYKLYPYEVVSTDHRRWYADGQQLRWKNKNVKAESNGKDQEIFFKKTFPVCDLRHETLRRRIVPGGGKDANNSGHLKSRKLDRDLYAYQKAHQRAGPFMVDPKTRMGVCLMTICKKTT